MRVKGGARLRQRHKKVLRSTKGYKDGRRRLFRTANQAKIKAGVNQYRDRRRRKRDFRRLWIARINAAAREQGLSYSRFVHGLKEAGVEIDRKMLAELAVNDAHTFAELVSVARQAIQA